MNHAPSSYDEMYDANGGVRAAYAGYCDWYSGQDQAALRRKGVEAESNFRRTGILRRRSISFWMGKWK